MTRTRTARERATLIGLAIIFVALPLLRGGRDAVALPIALGLLSIILVFLSVEGRLLGSAQGPRWQNPFLWIGMFLALVAAGLLFSINRFNTATGLVELIALAGFFFLGTRLRHEERALSGILCVSAVFLSLIGLWRFFSASGFRLGSTFENANAFSGFLILPLFLIFALVRDPQRPFFRWARRIAGAFIGIALILTFSITAWVSAAAGIAVWWFIAGRPRPSRRGLLALFGVLGMLLIALIGFRWIRSGSLADAVSPKETFTVAAGRSSLTQRLHFLTATGAMMLERPVLGSGYNTWAILHPMFQSSPLEKPLYAHSWYAQSIAETGALGAGVLLGIFATVGLAIKRQRQTGQNGSHAALAAGLVAAAINGGIDFAWNFLAVGIPVAFFAGLATADEKPSESDRQLSIATAWRRSAGVAGILIVFCSALVALALFYGRSLQTSAGERLKIGDTETAKEWLAQSLVFAPDPNVRRDYANLLFQTAADDAEKEGARQIADRAVREDPYDGHAHHLLGIMAIERGDAETAEAEFRTALRYDPINNPPFALDLATLLVQEARWPEVETLLSGYLAQYAKDRPSLNPLLPRQLAEMNQLLGEAAIRRSDAAAAKAFFQIALQEDPTFPLTDAERAALGE